MGRRLCTPVLECKFLGIAGRFLKQLLSWTNLLPLCHWRVMMKMMQCAEYAFEAISDHQVISNVHHAKRLVPFKTIKIPSCNEYTPLKYYGGIGFGCNLFLWWHTDSDFTMSIASIHSKGKDQYKVDDDAIVYFCFPTLGVAVPLRPGVFLIFNSLIPHCVSSDASKLMRYTLLQCT